MFTILRSNNDCEIWLISRRSRCKTQIILPPYNSPLALHHPAGTSVISALSEGFYNGGLWENIFWSIHKWLIDLNTKLLLQNYILNWEELSYIGNFSSWLRDVPDIYRFPVMHMVKTEFLLENLWISGASLCLLEKFQCSSAIPNMKYNCAILFLCQMYLSFVYASKYIFW